MELHGFLSYLVRCNVEGREYKIFGYKGKQVRDNIHSEDVANFIVGFLQMRRAPAKSTTLAAAKITRVPFRSFCAVEKLTGKTQKSTYLDQNRIGDHICYYSDLRKMKSHYPKWGITRTLQNVFEEIVQAWHQRLPQTASSQRG